MTIGLSLRPGVCAGLKPVAPFVDGPAALRLARSSSLESRVEDMLVKKYVYVYMYVYVWCVRVSYCTYVVE